MSARRLTTTLVAAGALVALAAPADAATAATYPSITKVTPLKATIGETLTVTGKGFVTGKGKTTVVFYRPSKRKVFATATATSTTKLTVVIPTKLAAILGKKNGQPVASRVQLRILAKRFGKKYTSIKASPVIAPAAAAGTTPPAAPAATVVAPTGTRGGGTVTDVPVPVPTPPADTDGDGTPDATDPDDDNDLLLDTTENALGTIATNADTDDDGLEDGWEYKSATDLKRLSCRTTGDYPTPCSDALPAPVRGLDYPNPLDGTDSGWDFDGDSLRAYHEHAGWKHAIARDASKRTLTSLWYSEGLQASVDTSPALGCRGMAVPEPFDGNGVRPEFYRPLTGTYPDVTQPEYDLYTLDNVGTQAFDGCLNDGERDEDGDFLNNFSETRGSLGGPDWWSGVYETEVAFEERPFYGTDWLNPNTDNRGSVDGLDDQDSDDFLNVEEQGYLRGNQSALTTGADTGLRDGLWVHAYNPCLPNQHSRTCPTTLEIGKAPYAPWPQKNGDAPKPRWPLYNLALYGTEVWAPPVGYDAGNPTPTHPVPR